MHAFIPLQGVRKGRHSKYVDVLNPGGTTKSSSSQPPPPPPSALGPVGVGLLGGSGQPFPGNFFVPQPIPGEGVGVVSRVLS